MNKETTPETKALIHKAYAGFNSRNIDEVFTTMHPNVHWPKAFEGGYVIGYDAIRDYWTRQWSEINPIVKPAAIIERPDGKIQVLVDQLVKDLDGNVLYDGKVKHVYAVEDGKLVSMDIEEG